MILKTREPNTKLAHIDACLLADVEYQKTTGLENYDFMNQAVCDIALNRIDLSTCWFGHKLKAPLMIAPMTGGVERGLMLNQRWARAAEHFQIAMGVGSQRLGLEDTTKASFYQIRQYAPTAFIFANLGAEQLCQGWGAKDAFKAIEMIRANALFIHLNAMQEACQSGDVDFSGLTQKLAKICTELKKQGVLVFAREVGFGMSKEATKRLIDVGVVGIDCAGAGGTSWAKVESFCAKTKRQQALGQRFGEWGIPTAASILNVRAVSQKIPLIATGGLRSGIDLAKAIALGADLGAMARPMLLAACESEEALFDFIETILLELRVCMFGAGVSSIDELKNISLVLNSSNTIPSR